MTAMFKLLFDTLFYYTLSAFFLTVPFHESPSPLGLGLLTLVLIGDGILRKKGMNDKWPRLLLLLLPLLLLLAKPGLPTFIHMSLAWAYDGYCILSDRVAADYYEFRQKLYTSIFLSFLILLFACLSEDGRESFGALLPFLSLMLCEGICTLRVLREKDESGRQILIMLVFMAGGALLTVGRAPQLLVKVLGFLYRYVIANGLLLLGGLAAVLFYGGIVLIYWLVTLFSDGPHPYMIEVQGELAQNLRGVEDGFTYKEHPVLTVLGYGLLALLIAYLLYRFFKGLLGDRSLSRAGAQKLDRKERSEGRRESGGFGLLAPREPRMRVRYYYAKFLKECRRRGMYQAPGATSEELIRVSRQVFPGMDTASIQKLYVKARYSEKEEVTKEEAEEAARFWHELKKSVQ